MSKNRNAAAATETVIDATLSPEPMAPTAPEATPETGIEVALPACPIHEELAAQDAEAEAAAAEAKNVPVYAPVADKLAAYKAPRGLETAMVDQLRKSAEVTYTVQQLVDALLESGAYMKVAPQAAALRPRKPVAFLLRKFAAAGVVAVR